MKNPIRLLGATLLFSILLIGTCWAKPSPALTNPQAGYYFITASYQFRLAQNPLLQSMIKEIVTHAQKESGNIFYYKTQNLHEPNFITFIGAWKNKAAYQQHINTAFFKKSRTALAAFHAHPPVINHYYGEQIGKNNFDGPCTHQEKRYKLGRTQSMAG